MAHQTFHSIVRRSQRNVNKREIDYILLHGKRYHRAGAIFYYLRRIDLPWDDRKLDQFNRLIGTAVVFSSDGNALLTVWRNRKTGLQKIKKKRKYTKSNPITNYIN